MTPTTILAQWREISRRATEAENAYFEAAIAYASGRGPQPSDSQVEETRRLREQSKMLFQQALAEINGGYGGFPPIKIRDSGSGVTK